MEIKKNKVAMVWLIFQTVYTTLDAFIFRPVSNPRGYSMPIIISFCLVEIVKIVIIYKGIKNDYSKIKYGFLVANLAFGINMILPEETIVEVDDTHNYYFSSM